MPQWFASRGATSCVAIATVTVIAPKTSAARGAPVVIEMDPVRRSWTSRYPSWEPLAPLPVATIISPVTPLASPADAHVAAGAASHHNADCQSPVPCPAVILRAPPVTDLPAVRFIALGVAITHCEGEWRHPSPTWPRQSTSPSHSPCWTSRYPSYRRCRRMSRLSEGTSHRCWLRCHRRTLTAQASFRRCHLASSVTPWPHHAPPPVPAPSPAVSDMSTTNCRCRSGLASRQRMAPPVPVSPSPTVTVIAPPAPPVALPVSMSTVPTLISPLTPLFSVLMTSAPAPHIITSAGEQDHRTTLPSADDPPWISTLPPRPCESVLLVAPPVTTTAPPTPPDDRPPLTSTAPPKHFWVHPPSTAVR